MNKTKYIDASEVNEYGNLIDEINKNHGTKKFSKTEKELSEFTSKIDGQKIFEMYQTLETCYFLIAVLEMVYGEQQEIKVKGEFDSVLKDFVSRTGLKNFVELEPMSGKSKKDIPTGSGLMNWGKYVWSVHAL